MSTLNYRAVCMLCTLGDNAPFSPLTRASLLVISRVPELNNCRAIAVAFDGLPKARGKSLLLKKSGTSDMSQRRTQDGSDRKAISLSTSFSSPGRCCVSCQVREDCLLLCLSATMISMAIYPHKGAVVTLTSWQ